ncbi:MAG TPA: SPOR domain-containing protein [Gammaproteobacteria bacterium]|nr:SPOR domain-containing protein [Gammaproteobacteria bacterium]
MNARVLFVLLLAANVACLAWLMTRRPPPVVPHTSSLAGRPSLRLLDELEPAERAARAVNRDTPLAAPPAAEASMPICAALGPYASEEMAAVAAARLRSFGVIPTVREQSGQIRTGYWVYLPPFPDRAAAERAVQELQAKGQADLYIVAAGEQENAVSLGLFSTAENADERAARIAQLGFRPRIAEHFREAAVYWVEFREDPARPVVAASVGVVGVDGTLPEKALRPCG